MSNFLFIYNVSIPWNVKILYNPLSVTIAELSSITAIEQFVYPCEVFISSYP